MTPRRTIGSLSLFITALVLVAGCSRGGSSTAQPQGSAALTASSIATSDITGEESRPNRCALLTDDEVREAIGAHSAGTSDAGNIWGLQGCRWTATAGGRNGWTDLVEVALFWKSREAWARAQAEGEPVQDFVEGARYNSSSGDLWFSCAHGRFCVVTARIGSGEPRRQQTALHLAQLVEKRLR